MQGSASGQLHPLVGPTGSTDTVPAYGAKLPGLCLRAGTVSVQSLPNSLMGIRLRSSPAAYVRLETLARTLDADGRKAKHNMAN